MTCSFEAVKARGRLDADTFDSRQFLLQAAGGADQRTSGTNEGAKMGDEAIGLFQNLDSGRVVVGLPVCVIAVLIWVEVAARVFRVNLLNAASRTVGPFGGVGQNEFGPVGLEDAD